MRKDKIIKAETLGDIGFVATAYLSGNSLVITVPDKLAKFVGIEPGDQMYLKLKSHIKGGKR